MTPFKRLGAYLSSPLQMTPAQRSMLAQKLLQQSQQREGPNSVFGTANALLQGLRQRRSNIADRDKQRTAEARQQGLAGALSRSGQGGAQGEAAKRAAMIIAGGLPDDPLAQGLLSAQAESTFAPKSKDRLIGTANPSDFEPASLAKYAQSGNPGDLVPRNTMFGRYTPSNYTPESWAKFVESGDPSALVNRGDFRFQTSPSGAVLAGNTVTGQLQPTSVTPEIATAEAAERKRAEAEAAAKGQATGTAQGAILSRALNAEGIDDILDIAEPLIDEATGSGTGAARDKLAAFFGESTTGAQAIAQLLPLQAAIMLRQPRMEGPQSDRDVQLYREAAGQLGDPAVPRETKKAAVQTIRRLQQQYKNAATPGAPAAGSDINSLLDKYAPR